MADPITAYKKEFNRYPSNAQVWSVAKDADELFDPSLMTDVNFGSSSAPKGHYILNVFNTSRQGIVEDSATDAQESTRPNTNAFFAGRFWCAGGTSKSLAGRIFYSQLIEGDRNIGKCYSDNDPTSEHFTDQTWLFSRKEWRPVLFREGDIDSDPNLETYRVSAPRK